MLAALVDGNSERAVSPITDVSRSAISRFGLALGTGAQRLHDRLVQGLRCELIQADEVFSYVGKKQARVTAADAPGIGETYSFTALDTASRLVIAWRVGKRDMEACSAFIADLRSRLLVMPQITTDGFAPHIAAVAKNFGLSVDFIQTVKNYRTGSYRGPDHRYEPPRDPFITKHTVFGAPDPKKASTAYVERLNGTTRHLLGRMRRLSYAFSKSPEHHRAAVALHYTYFNLCWTVRTLRVTPPMEAGLTGHVWSLEELLDRPADRAARLEAAAAAPGAPAARSTLQGRCPAAVASCGSSSRQRPHSAVRPSSRTHRPLRRSRPLMTHLRPVLRS
ncbi:transposase [Sorangium cellulosum]|uniref:Transposase n=1 Tax=Sorangium cellulosum TaxID=56 RepID=A0A150SKF1_SORCE|nr:transposase [Sorangium cellulosum]